MTHLAQFHIEFCSLDLLLSSELLVDAVNAERGAERVKAKRVEAVVSWSVTILLALGERKERERDAGEREKEREREGSQ